jgi:hypothetical protein
MSEFQILYEEEKKKNHQKELENQRLREAYQHLSKFVPREKLKPIYETEEETFIAKIQRAVRRTLQTKNIVNTSKKKNF